MTDPPKILLSQHTLLGLIGVGVANVRCCAVDNFLRMSTCPDADTEPYVQSRHDPNGNSVTHGRLPRVRA
jgi:hypothetical protein